MTVAELQAALRGLPPSAKVSWSADEAGNAWLTIGHVVIDEEGRHGR